MFFSFVIKISCLILLKALLMSRYTTAVALVWSSILRRVLGPSKWNRDVLHVWCREAYKLCHGLCLYRQQNQWTEALRHLIRAGVRWSTKHELCVPSGRRHVFMANC